MCAFIYVWFFLFSDNIILYIIFYAIIKLPNRTSQPYSPQVRCLFDKSSFYRPFAIVWNILFELGPRDNCCNNLTPFSDPKFFPQWTKLCILFNFFNKMHANKIGWWGWYRRGGNAPPPFSTFFIIKLFYQGWWSWHWKGGSAAACPPFGGGDRRPARGPPPTWEPGRLHLALQSERPGPGHQPHAT